MNIAKTSEIVSNNLDDTLEIGKKIGQALKGGEIIELKSDIGGGKTVFVRGLAMGVDSPDQVASPTFTISRHYKTSRDFTIHHYDFYRLEDPGLMKSEVEESIIDPHTTVAIEWGESVDDVLPDDRLQVAIESTGEYSRLVKVSAGPDHAHLLDKL